MRLECVPIGSWAGPAPSLARGKSLARPMGAVAIRLPERMSSGLALAGSPGLAAALRP